MLIANLVCVRRDYSYELYSSPGCSVIPVYHYYGAAVVQVGRGDLRWRRLVDAAVRLGLFEDCHCCLVRFRTNLDSLRDDESAYSVLYYCWLI